MGEVDIWKIKRALEVLGHPEAITFGSDWFDICQTACVALNQMKDKWIKELNDVIS